MEAEPRLERLMSALVGWMRRIPPDEPALADRRAFLATQPAAEALQRLREAGLATWAGRIEALREGEGAPATPDIIAAEVAVGRALGRACAEWPDEDAFRRAEEVIRHFRDAEVGFPEGGDEGLGRAPRALPALEGMLLERVNRFTAAPRRMARVQGMSTCALVEHHRRRARLHDCWGERPMRGMLRIRDTRGFDLLRRAAPDAYLRVLEAFPHPEPVRQILQAAELEHDLDALCLLLTEAKPAFGADGRWLPETKAPLFLLAMAGEHLRLLPESAGGTGTEDDGFQTARAKVVGCLSARPDMPHLGFAWAQRLVQEGGARGPWRRAGDAETGTRRLLALLGALADMLPDHPCPVQWIADEGDVRRRERTVAALLPFARDDHPNRGAAGALVERVAQEGLSDRTGLAAGLADYWLAETAVIGTVLSEVPAVADWFEGAWRRLMPVRDRARYRGEDGHDHRGAGAGLFLVTWTLHALGRLAPGSAEARALWTALERAIRESRLTEPDIPGLSDWPAAQAFLAAMWPRTFPDHPPSGEPGSLADFLAPFARPDDAFVDVLLHLRADDVDAAGLAEAAGGTAKLVGMLTLVATDQRRRDEREAAPSLKAPSVYQVRLGAFIEELRTGPSAVTL